MFHPYLPLQVFVLFITYWYFLEVYPYWYFVELVFVRLAFCRTDVLSASILTISPNLKSVDEGEDRWGGGGAARDQPIVSARAPVKLPFYRIRLQYVTLYSIRKALPIKNIELLER